MQFFLTISWGGLRRSSGFQLGELVPNSGATGVSGFWFWKVHIRNRNLDSANLTFFIPKDSRIDLLRHAKIGWRIFFSWGRPTPQDSYKGWNFSPLSAFLSTSHFFWKFQTRNTYDFCSNISNSSDVMSVCYQEKGNKREKRNGRKKRGENTIV